MKELRKTGPIILRRVIGNLQSQRRIIAILAVAAGLLPASKAVGTEINLVTPYPGQGSFAAGTSPGGNTAIYTTYDGHPTGTGVFDPFLTYQRKGIEEGYNTSQGHGQGYLDTKRVDQWNHDLHVGDLAAVPGPNGTGSYFVFELDANETGVGNINRLLSIDDIRIYTSKDDVAGTVQNSPDKFATTAGVTLQYAQNASLTRTEDNWVLIDASRAEGGSTSGSGSSDLRLYVPTALFDDAGKEDFLYFYTINGVHDSAADGSQSNAGFEEWKALTATVPDGGSTLLLLGSSLTVLGFFAGRRGLAGHA
jgi:hypothetical protein